MDEDLLKKKLEVPKEDSSDFLVKTGKIILGAVSGGTGSELLDLVIRAPIEGRMDVWRENVAEILLELNKNGHPINNEEFVSLLQQASVTAIRTHLEEKRKFLMNALLRSIDSELSYDIKSIFLNLINELTLSHVAVLNSLRFHPKHLQFVSNVQDLHDMLTKAEPIGVSEGVPIYLVPQINCGSKTQLSYILKDLSIRNLLHLSPAFKYEDATIYEESFIFSEDTNKGLPMLVVSQLGFQFLAFIKGDK